MACGLAVRRACRCSMPPAGTKLPSGTVLVTAHLDHTILNFATSPNVTVIAMLNFLGSTITKDWESHDVLERPQIAAQRTYWPTAWWIGTKTNNNAAHANASSNSSSAVPNNAKAAAAARKPRQQRQQPASHRQAPQHHQQAQPAKKPGCKLSIFLWVLMFLVRVIQHYLPCFVL